MGNVNDFRSAKVDYQGIYSAKVNVDEQGLNAFASNLKKIRKNKNYTQEKFVYDSGLSLSQIAPIETCKINPTISTVFKIASTLKIRPSELFDFDLK
jgi:DNA-binding XRE family transcriptional regulator